MNRPDLLREARMRAGLTQVQLAAQLGVHRRDVSRRERGLRPVPDTWLPRLSLALGVTEAMLAGRVPMSDAPECALDPELQAEREASKGRMEDPERRKWIVGRAPLVRGEWRARGRG